MGYDERLVGYGKTMFERCDSSALLFKREICGFKQIVVSGTSELDFGNMIPVKADPDNCSAYKPYLHFCGLF